MAKHDCEKEGCYSPEGCKQKKIKPTPPAPAEQVDAARLLRAHRYEPYHLRSGCSCGWGTTLCSPEEGWNQWADHVAASLKQETQPPIVCAGCNQVIRNQTCPASVGGVHIVRVASSPLETPAAGILQSVTKARCLNLDSPDALTNAVKNALATPPPADTGAAKKFGGS